MNLIVLAAGKGTRLGGNNQNMPKVTCRLPNGLTLFDYYVDAQKKVNTIEKIIFVTGFAAHVIDVHIDRVEGKKSIYAEFNPFYSLAGPIASVWIARQWMEGADFLLCNGDTFYSPQIFSNLISHNGHGIVLATERNADYGRDGMNVVMHENGHLKNVSKEIPQDEADGVSTGLVMVRGDGMRRVFVDAVSQMVRRDEYLQPKTAWHTVLNVLIKQGIFVETVNVTAKDWHEVDILDDVCRLDAKLKLAGPQK